MIIPQSILDAYAAIVCDNPPPDITGQPITADTLTATKAQLTGWTQAEELTQQQLLAAQRNVQTLQTQVASLEAMLSQ